MNLKPELLATLTSLGITEAELPVLFDRMMSLVTSREASINALSAQIEVLSAQRQQAITELEAGNAIALKLLQQ